MIFAQIFYLIAILGGMYGCWVVFSTVNGIGVDNIMQQIARVTFAISYAVLPYVIARSVESLAHSGNNGSQNSVYQSPTNTQRQEESQQTSSSTVEQFREESKGEWRTNPLTGRRVQKSLDEDIKNRWPEG